MNPDRKLHTITRTPTVDPNTGLVLTYGLIPVVRATQTLATIFHHIRMWNRLFMMLISMLPGFLTAQITIIEPEFRLERPLQTRQPDEEPPTCFSGDEHAFLYTDPGRIAMSDVVPHCLEIYVETDFFTYSRFGSVAATLAWIKRIEDNVRIVYENEGIHVRFVSVYVPTTTEWSDGLNSVTSILNEFGLVRKNSPGDIKHFITARGLGGGVAWVDMLCRQSPSGSSWGPFAVSANMSTSFPNYPSYSWNVSVFCHETGHVIGSRHTQSCVWGPSRNMRIDDCVGAEGGPCDVIMPIQYSTIMSYCHLTSRGISLTVGFGTLPGDLLRAKINSSICLGSGVDKSVLSGNFSGVYAADTICLVNAVNTNNAVLHANTVEISNSVLNPLFEINLLSCSE